MKNYKNIMVMASMALCFLLVGCSDKNVELSEDVVSLTTDETTSKDGNYVIVVELKDGIEDVSYTLIENGKIIGAEDNVNEAILKENVMQNKKSGSYKYTLNVKDKEDKLITKEVTGEVEDERKDDNNSISKDNTNDISSDKDEVDNHKKDEDKKDNEVSENTQSGTWDYDSKDYAVGDIVTFNGKTYSCLQGHTSQEAWDPVNTPALWKEKK